MNAPDSNPQVHGGERTPPTRHAGIAETAQGDSAANVVVSVRWWDGYLETFDGMEARFGSDLLWIRLTTGQNRHIPLRSVRWFSVTPESHEASQAAAVRDSVSGGGNATK